MEGSVIKGLELNDSDANIPKSSSSIVSRIYVAGYDTSLSGHDFFMSMRKHFASCGEVLHVYIPGHAERRTLNRFSLVYLRGEGAEEKALTLSGSYSRGHTLVVEPYPFHAKHLDHELAPTRDEDNKHEHTITVGGYDTSLPLKYAEGMLFQELSKHGRIVEVYLFEDEENEAVLTRDGVVFVVGIDTVEKLLQLCGCDVEGMENIKVTGVAAPDQDGASACDMPPPWFFEYSSSMATEVMAATAPEDPNLPKPPCKSTLLPYPWRSSVDSGTGYMCISNTETGDIMYEGPPFSSKPASTIRYASEDPTLPKPWKGLVDSSSGYLYFWNTVTNVTQYQRPPSN